jgi:hypothetical protein
VYKYLVLSLLLLYVCPRFFANNGRIIHIAWTETNNGSIQVADAAQHGINVLEQRNQFLNYKDPNDPFFKIRFTWLGTDWTVVHFLALLFTILVQILTFRRINRRMTESRFFRRWSYRFLKIVLWCAVIGGNIVAIWAIDIYNNQIHYRFHKLKDFTGATTAQLDKARGNRKYFLAKESTKLGCQLFINKNGKWQTQRALPVLHLKKTKNGKLFYSHDSRYIKLNQDSKRSKATTQLVVIHCKNRNGNTEQQVFEFQNSALTPHTLKADRPQRILLFINGYRPISTSQDPEKALQAINNKGLERPRSKNIIYSADNFGYWPKEAFVTEIQKRIKPNRTLYADGHHSVSTSNHLSLLQFVSSAALYPQPCKGTHHCSTTKIANQKEVRTYNLLSTKPNYAGFHTRYLAGKQAGRNLYQELTRNGNNPLNDTLYAVSHSMGHAYFMGMASVLRGKIQFGTYHAFCPENPKGKKLRSHLWLSVFQYGTKLFGTRRHAPCQQDGVAPQWRISGLTESQQIIFPKSLYSRLGYFSSHYIGYYTWVFAIPKNKPGYIGLP